jgi:hypothetical protein
MTCKTRFCLRLIFIVLLGTIAFSLIREGDLQAQYRRGAYTKKLLLAVDHDKDALPKNKKYAFIRSIGSETHAVIWDMNMFYFYIDKDNTTEDSIDEVFSYNPLIRNSLKRIENTFAPGEFQKFKEKLIRSGLTDDFSNYTYPGMDDLLVNAQKNRYIVKKDETGFLIQLRDADSNQVKTRLGVDAQNSSLYIENNFDYGAGKWIDSMIIFPVYSRKTTDPTIKKLAEEGAAKFSKILEERK